MGSGPEAIEDRSGQSATGREATGLGPVMSRRAFVAGATAAGAVAAAASYGLVDIGSAPVVKALGRSVDAAAPGTRQVAETVYDVVCSQNCWQTCRLEAHVRNGRLVKTAMNPFPESRYDRICLRGLSHSQWIYNPARIKFPMKRVGPRGSGKWQRITWNEAVDTIASNIKSVQQRYGSKAFAFFSGSGNYGAVSSYAPGVLGNLLQATSISNAVDEAFTLGGFQVGLATSWLGGNEPLDMSNADLLVMWGNNLTEAQVQEWHFVADALGRGAQLVVIDPNFSITASKADKWIPLRPGSDAAFGLSVLNVMLTEHLFDASFVSAQTTLPFLVRQDNGMFLRSADGKSILVWDPAKQAAVPADTVTSPALTGSYTVGGVAVRPAFERLADRVATWTPEYAQQFTEVEPSDVRWFARTYAATRKSFVFPSMGVDRWYNADLVGRTLGVMAALTHNFGQSGAAVGCAGGASMFHMVNHTSPTGTMASPLPVMAAYDAIDTGSTKILVPLDGKNPAKGVTAQPQSVAWPIKAIWFTKSNAVSNVQESKRFIRLLSDESKIELVVVSDSLPTDTVRYADIVLPSAHWFETDEVVGTISHPYMLRIEKALDPPFEAKSDYDAIGLVAAKLGYGEYYSKSAKEIADSVALASTSAAGAGGAAMYETYQQTGAVRLVPPDYVGNTSSKFSTPTGRLEPYSESVMVNYPSGGRIPISEGVDPLPYWEPPVEAWYANPLAKKYPLVYMQEHSRWRVHTTYFAQAWLREVDPEPYIDINPTDATSRGIKSGDRVQMFNDHGSTEAVARVSGKMRPGMVSIPKGWQRSQTRDGSGFSDPTSNWVNQRTMNGSWFDNLVDVRKVSA